MYDLIKSIADMPPPFNMIVFVMLIACAASVLKITAKQIRAYGCHRQDIDFKRDLVERGMSVDEIERIVKAGNANGADTCS